jgi:hypothetical protein
MLASTFNPGTEIFFTWSYLQIRWGFRSEKQLKYTQEVYSKPHHMRYGARTWLELLGSPLRYLSNLNTTMTWIYQWAGQWRMFKTVLSLCPAQYVR